MTDAGQSPHAGPLVCPFVALAEDRDRRADAPDDGNRCYAEKAPRRRDLVYQADYCYSPRFASCSIFLAWAARNAAEPAYVTEAARTAWASGIATPEVALDGGADVRALDGGGGHASAGSEALADEEPPVPTPEGGFFGPAGPGSRGAEGRGTDELDWISASAWAEAPWDPDAEEEAQELESRATADPDEEPVEEEEEAAPEEALQGPKVPAALPMRRRRPPQEPIRTRGSGEWYYADPLEREPLVRRRGSVGPPILLAVLGLLVVSIVVFLLPSLLDSGGSERIAAMTSPSPGASAPPATRAPLGTALPSAAPSSAPEPRIRSYTVKSGDTLSGIAAKAKVSMRLLQCMNVLLNPNVLQPGQKLLIPPDGYACPPGWRRMTPPPVP